MIDEGTIKLDLARLQADTVKIEREIEALNNSVSQASILAEREKARVTEEARSAFCTKQTQDANTINSRCDELYSQVDALLDTFPGLRTKEYAGKYEIKSLEEKLSNIFPEGFLKEYVCSDLKEFESESEAYRTYLSLERRVVGLKQWSAASALFSGLTSLLNAACRGSNSAGKIGLAFIAILCLSFVVSPFIFLAVFSVIGVTSLVQGMMFRRILKDLSAVKEFLNDSYDEDIFQEDKQDILARVQSFLDGVREDYIAQINAREFKMSPSLLLDIDKKVQDTVARDREAILVKQKFLDEKRKAIAEKLSQLDELVKQNEIAAKEARVKYLEKVDWKREWVNELLIDVTPNNRVVTTPWTQSNSLYYAKDVRSLESFWKLAVYQLLLNMPPDYCGQVVLDYVYMGKSLFQFSRVAPSMLTLCVKADEIQQKIERMQEDLYSRISNILKSCENLQEFNNMMKEYGSVGEAYVVVHICGLKSVTDELRSFLKNGTKVGYFFKIYLTYEELQAVGGELPFEDFKECAEIADVVMPRTIASVRRLLESGA